MALYPIQCFFNTGLSVDSAMDSLDLVKTVFQSKTYESVWVLQDRNLGQVKINATYDDIKNCDYCIIGNTGYHVMGVSMINENVSALVLSCDYITTVGLSNIEVVDGWCLRRSPTEDTLFSNEIPESFQPTEPLKLEIVPQPIDTGTEATSDYKIVISTVNLTTGEYMADKYTGAQTDLFVMVPKIPIAAIPTVFFIGGLDSSYKYELPAGTAYNYSDEKVKNGIQSVRSLGIDACILASYTIPKNYVSVGNDKDEAFGGIIGGVDADNVDSSMKVEYAQVKNKKVFSGQFMKFGIVSIASGSRCEYEPEHIVKDGALKWRIMANPLPSGKPFAMPAFYNGETNARLYGAVAGEQWQQNTIEFRQPSGALKEYTGSQRGIMKGIATAGAVAGAAVIGGASVGGAIVSAIPKAKSLAGVSQAVSKFAPQIAASGTLALGSGAIDWLKEKSNDALTAISEQKQREIMFRAPDLEFTPTESLQNFFGNTFIEYRIRLSDNDTKRFDKFLTANGYAVSEPLKADFFHSHVNFNFITCDNARVRTGYGLLFDNAVAGMLQNGVRIWHVRPSNAALYDNPITGGTNNVV